MDDQKDNQVEENQPSASIEPSEVELLQKKVDEYLAGWQRARADYQNLKKETEKRTSEVIQFANAALVAELLPIYSHFKLALSHVPADQKKLEWVKGFEHIRSQLKDFFKKLGIEEIATVGQPFNPDFHEAVAHEAHEGFATDVIFAEVSPGYTLHGKVIQPTKVKVAK